MWVNTSVETEDEAAEHVDGEGFVKIGVGGAIIDLLLFALLVVLVFVIMARSVPGVVMVSIPMVLLAILRIPEWFNIRNDDNSAASDDNR